MHQCSQFLYWNWWNQSNVPDFSYTIFPCFSFTILMLRHRVLILTFLRTYYPTFHDIKNARKLQNKSPLPIIKLSARAYLIVLFHFRFLQWKKMILISSKATSSAVSIQKINNLLCSNGSKLHQTVVYAYVTQNNKMLNLAPLKITNK